MPGRIFLLSLPVNPGGYHAGTAERSSSETLVPSKTTQFRVRFETALSA